MFYSLMLGVLFGSATIQCLDLFWDTYYNKGTTNNKKKLLGAIDQHMKHKKPALMAWFDNVDGIHCCCKIIDLTPDNLLLIKRVLTTQDWSLVLSEEELKDIDAERVKEINGTYINSFMFSINYCERG